MSIYKEYRREPSIPHQCMHHSNKHGERCRGRAMHNEVMCFQHRIEDLPTVLQNDPFELTSLYDRASIQHVVTQVAARLACNRIDLKRATLLLQACQIAAANLTAHDRAANAKIAAPPLTPPTTSLDPNPDPEALVRYQAYRAELGLDEEDEEDAPLTAESRPLTADSENPATILPTLKASATSCRRPAHTSKLIPQSSTTIPNREPATHQSRPPQPHGALNSAKIQKGGRRLAPNLAPAHMSLGQASNAQQEKTDSR
jgi:hypothetical protein